MREPFVACQSSHCTAFAENKVGPFLFIDESEVAGHFQACEGVTVTALSAERTRGGERMDTWRVVKVGLARHLSKSDPFPADAGVAAAHESEDALPNFEASLGGAAGALSLMDSLVAEVEQMFGGDPDFDAMARVDELLEAEAYEELGEEPDDDKEYLEDLPPLPPPALPPPSAPPPTIPELCSKHGMRGLSDGRHWKFALGSAPLRPVAQIYTLSRNESANVGAKAQCKHVGHSACCTLWVPAAIFSGDRSSAFDAIMRWACMGHGVSCAVHMDMASHLRDSWGVIKKGKRG